MVSASFFDTYFILTWGDWYRFLGLFEATMLELEIHHLEEKLKKLAPGTSLHENLIEELRETQERLGCCEPDEISLD